MMTWPAVSLEPSEPVIYLWLFSLILISYDCVLWSVVAIVLSSCVLMGVCFIVVIADVFFSLFYCRTKGDIDIAFGSWVLFCAYDSLLLLLLSCCDCECCVLFCTNEFAFYRLSLWLLCYFSHLCFVCVCVCVCVFYCDLSKVLFFIVKLRGHERRKGRER